MRALLCLVVVGLLAGCGSSTPSSAPTASPVATASPQSLMNFPAAPAMTINRNANYEATVSTTAGSFSFKLLPRIAPIAVNSFVFLARHKFFHNIIFHRIVKDFVVQTGDPTGTGTGGPGYSFKDEKVTLPYTRGTVAMANSGANTNGSQFFVVVAHNKLGLPPNYTIFGRVTSGMGVVDKIAAGAVEPNPAGGTNEVSYPVYPVSIKTITIHQS